jgi:hypothetical protein
MNEQLVLPFAVADLFRISHRPGDVFVLTLQGQFSWREVEALKAMWKASPLNDAPLIILQEGMKLESIRRVRDDDLPGESDWT